MSPRTTCAGRLVAANGLAPTVSVQDRVVVGFKSGEGGIEHFPARHDNDIESTGNLVTPEQLARQAFRAVPDHGVPELTGRRHSEPEKRPLRREHEHGHEAAANPLPVTVNPFELWAASDTRCRGQTLAVHLHPQGRRGGRQPSSDTVSRFRPLARRRARTIRPFFVAMRTRKP